jgi:hypothetical protein
MKSGKWPAWYGLDGLAGRGVPPLGSPLSWRVCCCCCCCCCCRCALDAPSLPRKFPATPTPPARRVSAFAAPAPAAAERRLRRAWGNMADREDETHEWRAPTGVFTEGKGHWTHSPPPPPAPSYPYQVHTYVRTYNVCHNYVRTYTVAYVRTYVHVCVRTRVPWYAVRTRVRTRVQI